MSARCLDAALDYAARGWPVLPLDGKRPDGLLVSHGVKDATTDEAVIREWFSREPSANVGLATGFMFDVLDVDGSAWVGARPPVGPYARTGSGGCHAYYATPERWSGNKVKFLPGQDWRGRGGYVVAPPSVHPVTRRVYEWLAGPDTPLPPVTERLLDALDPPRGELKPLKIKGSPTAYGEAALLGSLSRVMNAEEGERNHALNRAAFSLGQLLVADVLTDSTRVTRALLWAADRAGLDGDEARKTIESGFNGAARKPREVRRG